MALLQIRTEIRRLWAFIRGPETLCEETLKTKLATLHDAIAESEQSLVVLHKDTAKELLEKGSGSSAGTKKQLSDALAYADAREQEIAKPKAPLPAVAPPKAPPSPPEQTA